MKTTTNIMKFGSLAAIVALALPLASAGSKKSSHTMNSPERAVRASNLIGIDVESSKGEDYASVSEIVISPTTGEIDALVVNAGFLGIGGPEKEIAYGHFDDARIDGWSISTTKSRSELERIPNANTNAIAADAATGSRVRTGSIGAMNYIYRDVESPEGIHIGTVTDWIVDLNDGTVPYLVLRRLNFGMVGDDFDYFAIGSEHVEGTRSGDIVVSLSEEDLSNAKPLDRAEGLNFVEGQGNLFHFTYRPDGLALAD